MRTTLFVAGFGARTRARELAYEFERYGRLIRCDIPAAKSFTAKPYAFVEYADPHDAEDAFNEMHGRSVDGYKISVQWARNAPSATWRLGGPTTTPNPPHQPRSARRRPSSRSMSPPPIAVRGRSPPNGRTAISLPYGMEHKRRYSYSRSRSRSPPPHSILPPHSHTMHYDQTYSSRMTSPPPHHHQSVPRPIKREEQQLSFPPSYQSRQHNYLHSPPL